MTSSTTPTPAASRPLMQGYGIQQDPEGLMDWSAADSQLTQSRNYWISTTGADGRPHAAPIWGVWLEGALYFGTSPTSRKGRNLAHSKEIVVHLESGDDVVILEGEVKVTHDREVLSRADALYQAKYGVPLLGVPDAGYYVFRPHTALAWQEREFPRSATRWRFPSNVS